MTTSETRKILTRAREIAFGAVDNLSLSPGEREAAQVLGKIFSELEIELREAAASHATPGPDDPNRYCPHGVVLLMDCGQCQSATPAGEKAYRECGICGREALIAGPFGWRCPTHADYVVSETPSATGAVGVNEQNAKQQPLGLDALDRVGLTQDGASPIPAIQAEGEPTEGILYKAAKAVVAEVVLALMITKSDDKSIAVALDSIKKYSAAQVTTLAADLETAREQYSALSCKHHDLARASEAAHRDCTTWAAQVTTLTAKLAEAEKLAARAEDDRKSLRDAWIRELGGKLIPKSHLIDALVLTTRRLRQKALSEFTVSGNEPCKECGAPPQNAHREGCKEFLEHYPHEFPATPPAGTGGTEAGS